MSISMNKFETLRQQYSSWPEMKAYFESDGMLRVVEQDGVAVVRYDKGNSADSVFRSVVWDMNSNLPLSVAPFRANDGFPPKDLHLSAVEDFIDGFMVNAWVADGEIQLSTRTRVGGENKFYSKKTFGELFRESLATTPLKTMDALRDCLEGLRTDVSGSSAFVSFVVQHPEHRIVAKVTSPGLYVVHTGYVLNTGAVHISERSINWPQALARLVIPSYPNRSFSNEAEVEELLRRTAAQRGWRWQGLVFKDGKGGRWRIRTPTYSTLRQLRGAESTALERFFRLRATHTMVDYLRHYGEERDDFWKYEQALRARTADVLAAYTDVHKAHALTFKELPESLRPAVYLLHLKWRDELRPKGFSVRLQNAIDVVNQLRGFEKKRLIEAAAYVAAPPKEAV